MADIRIDFQGELSDGQVITFKAPCDCTAIDKLKVYHRQGEELTPKLFTMKDSLGNTLSGIGNLFASGAYVTATLDTTNNFAYLQNSCNNGYIAERVGKQIRGYDTERGVDISGYSMTNQYTVPEDGVVNVSIGSSADRIYSARVLANTYKTDGTRIGYLTIGYIVAFYTNGTGFGAEGTFPVYKGQKIYYTTGCPSELLEIKFHPYYYG